MSLVINKAIIIGITSDIGSGIKNLLELDNWQVFGTSTLIESEKIVKLDLADLTQVESFSTQISKFKDWSLLCLFAGTMAPIGPFFEIDFNKWENNFRINFFSQLKILKALWPYRSKSTEPNICFLAGGGTNSTFDNYSAYCLSKIILIKFVELIASENKDGKFFIIGPGFMKTKIHHETFNASINAGQNYEKTRKFMIRESTSIERLYKHLNWCISQPKLAISGRNFSTVHDLWDKDTELTNLLLANSELFKLRRKDYRDEKI